LALDVLCTQNHFNGFLFGKLNTTETSKTFTGDAPKAIAMIAVGRAVLDEKP